MERQEDAMIMIMMKLMASQRRKIRAKLRETHDVRPTGAELDPMDTLWEQGEDAASVNTQYKDIDQKAELFIERTSGLSNNDAFQASSAVSAHSW